MNDDCRKLHLDAKELLSNIRILLGRQFSGPRLEMTWQRKVLLVPYECPHLVEGVVGILLTVRRLLDAGEVRYMGEHVVVVPDIGPLEGASR